MQFGILQKKFTDGRIIVYTTSLILVTIRQTVYCIDGYFGVHQYLLKRIYIFLTRSRIFLLQVSFI